MRENFVKLRDNFSEIWYKKYLKMCNCDWDFYINSNNENLSKMSEAQNEYYSIFKDKEFYENFTKISEEISKNPDKNNLTFHEKKQLKNILKDFEEEFVTGEDLKLLRDKENEIAQKFNSYIPKIDGNETSKTELTKILQTSSDIELRKKAYQAKILSGDLISEDLKQFVEMRNAFARKKGLKNYYEYKLTEDYEVDLNDLLNLLEEVYSKSYETIKQIVLEKQKELKEFFKTETLKPYHYGYLTENNPEKKVNEYFKDTEQIIEISKNTYKKMGYDVDKLIENKNLTLDLFPRKGKNTHGFCFDIDAGVDARILANLTNNVISLDTLNHEMGHCIYTLGISRELPFIDRQTYPAMTEAIAMMMGDIQKRENILEEIVPADVLEEFKQSFRKDEANFIINAMTIINFEKEMYENPNQDLSKLWHDMKVKYQFRGEDEEMDNSWATIPHYLSHPAYYQNYFRATLIKAQIYKTIGNITNNPKSGEYLKEKLFKYGTSLEENELIENFTGKKLAVDDFINSLK